MPIPDFQRIMLPMLELAGDGEVHKINDFIGLLADRFNLTNEQRLEKLSSGKQNRFDNRVYWSKIHLSRAKPLDDPGRGLLRISQRGRDTLASKPDMISVKSLQQFPEYQAFTGKDTKDSPHPGIAPDMQPSQETPQEMIETGYQRMKDALSSELLDQIMKCSPTFFEALVVDLLVAMGYGGSRKDAGMATKQSGDGGIDGLIKEDKLGLDVIYIQAKRWQNTVGKPEIQGFAGSLEGEKAKKGVFITTSKFSQGAHDYVKHIEKKVILIDGAKLTDLLIEHKVGVDEVTSYTICKLDLDYFETE